MTSTMSTRTIGNNLFAAVHQAHVALNRCRGCFKWCRVIITLMIVRGLALFSDESGFYIHAGYCQLHEKCITGERHLPVCIRPQYRFNFWHHAASYNSRLLLVAVWKYLDSIMYAQNTVQLALLPFL